LGHPRGGTEVAPGGALGVCWPAFLCCCLKGWPTLDVGQSHQSGQLACCLLGEGLILLLCKKHAFVCLAQCSGNCCFACPLNPLLACLLCCLHDQSRISKFILCLRFKMDTGLHKECLSQLCHGLYKRRSALNDLPS